ncbi:MAG: DJ-1/PfpI family protein [Dehalococcoidia bacterium]
MTRTFGIVIFPDVEELDFVGPIEVFGSFAKYFDKDWRVVTVAQTSEPVHAAKGLTVVPDHTFDDCPPLEVVLVPGGFGTRQEMSNPAMLDFVQRTGGAAQWVTSVCTGALVLSRAGFLKGREATTHWAALNELRAEPDVRVVERRFAVDGNVITAAGVSAGIDMALYLVGQLASPETARNVQKAIEYYPEPPFAEEAVAASSRKEA